MVLTTKQPYAKTLTKLMTNKLALVNALTAMKKNSPCASGFLVKIKFFKIIYARDKIFMMPDTNIV